MSQIIIDENSTTPNTPSAGQVKIYSKTDHKLYSLDSNGTESVLSGDVNITDLTGDVTAHGPGSVSATVNSVGGSSASNIHSAELLANAATNANTASTIVKRDASGNFSAGTITANLSGNATNFTGSLSGDVTGTQSSTVVSSVGGSSASNVHTAELLANAATSSSSSNTIVKRDANSNFSTNSITQGVLSVATTGGTLTLTVSSVPFIQFTGSTTHTTILPNATTLTNGQIYYITNNSSGSITVNYNDASLAKTIPSNTNVRFVLISNATSNGVWSISNDFINALTGDVSASGLGSVSSTVNSVGGSSASNIHSAELLANAATSNNTASAIVKRDASGNFNASKITATSIQDTGLSAGFVLSDGSGNLSSSIRLLPATNRHIYVTVGGDDINGDGTYENPYASISKAMSVIPYSDYSNAIANVIRVGPGRFTESTIVLKPWTWIVGHGRDASAIVINTAPHNLTFHSDWDTVSSRGGLINLSLSFGSGINYDASSYTTLAGNVFLLTNTTITGDLIFHGKDQNVHYLDYLSGWIFGSVTADGATIDIVDANIAGNLTISTVNNHDTNADIVGTVVYGNATFSSTVGHTNPCLLGFSRIDGTLTIDQSGTSLNCQSSSLPIKANVTVSNGATLTRTNDVYGVGYTPTAPGNWSVVPNNAQDALDTLASSKQATGNYITALTGDVSASGPGSASSTVNSVGGSSASNIHAAELLANAATNANTASTIVKRDASGNFSAGTITATIQMVSGNIATTNTNYTVAAGVKYVLVDTTNPVTITLPAPNYNEITIKDKTGNATTNPITLARHASESIDGLASNKTLVGSWNSWTFVDDGTNWYEVT